MSQKGTCLFDRSGLNPLVVIFVVLPLVLQSFGCGGENNPDPAPPEPLEVPSNASEIERLADTLERIMKPPQEGEDAPPDPLAEYPPEIRRFRRVYEFALTKGIEDRINILTLLHQEFPDLSFDDEVLAALAHNHNIRRRPEEAAKYHKKLLKRHPESLGVFASTRYLHAIAKQNGDKEATEKYAEAMLDLISGPMIQDHPEFAQGTDFYRIEYLDDLGRKDEAKTICLSLKESTLAQGKGLEHLKASTMLIQLRKDTKEYESALREARYAYDLRIEEDKKSGLKVKRPPSPDFERSVAGIARTWIAENSEALSKLKALEEEIRLTAMLRDKEAIAVFNKALGNS